MAVSLDQAVANAVAARLAARLSGVTVRSHWPDDTSALPAQAVTVLVAGTPADILVDPTVVASENIHAEMPTRIEGGAVVDLATAIPVLNQAKSTWNAHAASTTVHKAADSTNTISSPDAVDLGTAIALANEIRSDFTPHVSSTVYHDVADSKSAITAPIAVDLASLVALSEQIRIQINRHYVARLYHWKVRVREIPIQIDAWATSHAQREDLIASIEAELDADGTSAQLDPGPRNGLLLDVADGWASVADCLFEAPQRFDSQESNERAEWRALFKASGDVCLVVKAQSARIAKATLKVTTYEQTLVGATPLGVSASYSPAGTTVQFT